MNKLTLQKIAATSIVVAGLFTSQVAVAAEEVSLDKLVKQLMVHQSAQVMTDVRQQLAQSVEQGLASLSLDSKALLVAKQARQEASNQTESDED